MISKEMTFSDYNITVEMDNILKPQKKSLTNAAMNVPNPPEVPMRTTVTSVQRAW